MTSVDKPRLFGTKSQSRARCAIDQKQGHRSGVVWFTGLSGSGKSTVANAVDQLLFQRGIRTFLLDGDNVSGIVCVLRPHPVSRSRRRVCQAIWFGVWAQDREERHSPSRGRRRAVSLSWFNCTNRFC